MNIEHYKQRLTALEKTLSARIERTVAAGRGEYMDSAHDAGDASVADEVASETFTEAELDSTTLTEIRAAIVRTGNGTFGRCVVDGGRIEEKRLAAAPWSAHCLKHEQQIEASTRRSKMSTL